LAIAGPEPLTAAHDLSDFSCGKPSLDRRLRTQALSNQQKGFTAVLVVHEASRVIGYYGLAPTTVVPSTLTRAIRTGQPPDPVPCLLLAQPATDRRWIGKGIATGLLKHALKRCGDRWRPDRRPRPDRQRDRCRRRWLLTTAQLHRAEGRSARPLPLDRRHRGVDWGGGWVKEKPKS
jgi:hypothetical protein